MGSRFETPGDFSWTELMTRDLKAAREFYSKVLGWEMEESPMGEGSTYVILKAGGKGIGGMMDMPEKVPAEVPAHWQTYVTVPDVDATAEKVRKHGGEIIVPPTDIPKVGRFSTFRDPEGAVLAVIAYSTEHN
jgi:predicted enzyme related to lactoylglutathione lyase